MDSEYRRARAPAAPVPSQLPNGASSVSAVVRARSAGEILTQLANMLREEGAIDERERFIDATVASAKGGGAGMENTPRGKGVKILAIVDRHGLPLSVSTYAANHHGSCWCH